MFLNKIKVYFCIENSKFFLKIHREVQNQAKTHFFAHFFPLP
jgi:hypothetical protein